MNHFMLFVHLTRKLITDFYSAAEIGNFVICFGNAFLLSKGRAVRCFVGF